jgi:predicted small integral membrane protein
MKLFGKFCCGVLVAYFAIAVAISTAFLTGASEGKYETFCQVNGLISMFFTLGFFVWFFTVNLRD